MNLMNVGFKIAPVPKFLFGVDQDHLELTSTNVWAAVVATDQRSSLVMHTVTPIRTGRYRSVNMTSGQSVLNLRYRINISVA
jgi:hypothetical protein